MMFFEFYYSLRIFFENKGYFNRNIVNIEYYKGFLDFTEIGLKESNKYANKLVKFNYLIYNKKRGLLDFLRSNISKEEERNIKNELREKYSFKEYDLEKFRINLERYMLDCKILEEDSYYIFNDNANYIHLEYEKNEV